MHTKVDRAVCVAAGVGSRDENEIRWRFAYAQTGAENASHRRGGMLAVCHELYVGCSQRCLIQRICGVQTQEGGSNR